jgi:pyruvate/2-oxoglutarate dehydrogenase complex dihydrolipoamide dehydrogenase (E3) component
MGGDCLNVGCVPSKAVLRAARGWQEARRAAERFGGPPAVGEGDFAAAFRRMRRLRADLAPHDGAGRFRDLGVDVFFGHGRFTGPDTLEVDGHHLHFRRGLVATGGRPAVPPIEGLEAAGYLTNETVFALRERPRRLAVIGAGPIGCELAQAFARFGCQVTLLDLAPRVLPREDAAAAEVVARALADDGVRLELGVGIRRVERSAGERVIDYLRDGAAGRVAAQHVLVAVGRSPNVEGLGLEAAGVACGRAGVEVDDRLRTTNPRIFAAGDVASRHQFTHVADAQARIVVENALFGGRKRASALVVPRCTYTAPEVAQVGLSEQEAAEQGVAIDTLTVPLSAVDRAVLDDEADGFLRVHLAQGKDRILGATLVAAHAGESIGELTLALGAGIGLGRLAAVIHPYPTQAEVVRKAADQWRRGRLTPLVRRLLGFWFRLLR